mmetsp:Transcript_17790/g.20270  ORF Transcript_17790/g.20270 Transcript_17790/m.20270 type:complete len:468 (+) Transcript_17790:160-1563(+)
MIVLIRNDSIFISAVVAILFLVPSQHVLSFTPIQTLTKTTNDSNYLYKAKTSLTKLHSTIMVSPPNIDDLPVSGGDADSAFRHGTNLERNGLLRTAHAAYHEAATLYQCFLDQDIKSKSHEFSHVTELIHQNENGEQEQDGYYMCRKYLADACMRLAFLSFDALGDPKASIRLYKEATMIDPKPNAIAFDGIGTSIEGSFPGNLKDAVKAYRKSLEIEDNGHTRFHLGVALERLGEASTAEEIMDGLRRSEASVACLVDSWGYIRWHTRRIPNDELNLYLGTRNVLQIGLEAAMDLVMDDNGLVCEFGVATGRSLRMMQELLPLLTPLHGFDTFHGLPSSWGGTPAGTFSTGGALPNMEGNVYFHQGLFRDSIPDFLESMSMRDYQPLAFANIDCAMYGSTLEILEKMHSRVVPGTVFVFADYIGHPSWRQDEFRAWRECCKRFGWQYEYLGFSFATKQVVVRITSA